MSYHLALRAPETFKAIASVAGAMSGKDWKDRRMAVPTPILHIHGTLDAMIPIGGLPRDVDGGWGGAPKMSRIVEFWSDVKRCRESRTDSPYKNESRHTHFGGMNSYPAIFYEVADLEHLWPRRNERSDFDASETIVEFFLNYVKHNP